MGVSKRVKASGGSCVSGLRVCPQVGWASASRRSPGRVPTCSLDCATRLVSTPARTCPCLWSPSGTASSSSWCRRAAPLQPTASALGPPCRSALVESGGRQLIAAGSEAHRPSWHPPIQKGLLLPKSHSQSMSALDRTLDRVPWYLPSHRQDSLC